MVDKIEMPGLDQIVAEFTQSFQQLTKQKDDADLKLFQAKALAKHQIEIQAKPCPLCGECLDIHFYYNNCGGGRAQVHCNSCRCTVSGEVFYNSLEEKDVEIQRMASAVKAWNRRAPIESTP